jgi:MoxR-like ATPase
MRTKIIKEISTLPLSILNGAIRTEGGEPVSDKPTAIQLVADLIESGKRTVEHIKASKRVDSSPAFATATTAPSPVGVSHEEMVELKLAVAKEMLSTRAHIDAQSKRVVDQVTVFSAELRDALDTTFEPVDYDKVGEMVRKQVAAIVEPFKRSAPEEVLVELASSLPVTTKVKVKDAFKGQVFTYTDEGEAVDFSEMTVTLWGDKESPVVVEDYVFNPQFLHESLVALERNIPINCWLAGERGTGKTEFVTQLAARLERKLYRINFDEAIERSDFIGGNTIVDGNVVWKAGVLTQAIQHAGAIVLLDEVGFARSQSISVLHSVCEPSPHRGVMINETGIKINVLPHVGFFCADNSNGFGDESGNFNGVRDQNTAFIDRFGYTFKFQYLPFDDEVNLIQKRTGINNKAAKYICNFAKVAREKCKSGLLTQPPSLRQLMAWAMAVKEGVPVKAAFKSAVVNKYPSDCESELLGVFTATINVEEFKRAMGA